MKQYRSLEDKMDSREMDCCPVGNMVKMKNLSTSSPVYHLTSLLCYIIPAIVSRRPHHGPGPC